ncbi:MAG: hypothetical protein IKC35_01690 [Clostridia bacterium]|nr:hypothetical protein [Clostridia bacterium]
MQLIKAKHKIKCEMGVCKNTAEYSIKMDRVGIRSQIHVCSDCLNELYKVIGESVIPKSVETAKKKGA